MWTFTTIGFFSAVCARQGDGSYGKPVDPDRMMIRARMREHLENLKRFASETAAVIHEDPNAQRDVDGVAYHAMALEHLCRAKIHVSTSTDYCCRMFIPKGAWAIVLQYLAMAEDYDNFKSAVLKAEGCKSDYEIALHGVWTQMYRLQEKSYGPGIYTKPSKQVDPAFADGDLPDGFDLDSLDDSEPVLKVTSRKGKVMCYVVRPRDFGTDEQAFESAVESYPEKHCKHPRFEHVSWGEVKGQRGKKGVLIY